MGSTVSTAIITMVHISWWSRCQALGLVTILHFLLSSLLIAQDLNASFYRVLLISLLVRDYPHPFKKWWAKASKAHSQASSGVTFFPMTQMNPRVPVSYLRMAWAAGFGKTPPTIVIAGDSCWPIWWESSLQDWVCLVGQDQLGKENTCAMESAMFSVIWTSYLIIVSAQNVDAVSHTKSWTEKRRRS